VLRSTYGYETVAYTDAPWFRGSRASLLQGFEGGSVGAGAQQQRLMPLDSGYWLEGTPAVLSRWLGARDASRPFFLMLHSFDAHDPYGRENKIPRDRWGPAEWKAFERHVGAFRVDAFRDPLDRVEAFLTDAVARDALNRNWRGEVATSILEAQYRGFEGAEGLARAERLRSAYEGGLSWVDDSLSGAVAWLEEKGLLENTLLVVTSDHGEAFGEHGTVSHGHHHHDELLHVPLVCVGPGPFREPRAIDASVGLADVMPTFFDFADLRALPGREGRSLLPLLRGEAEGHPVVAEHLLLPSMATPDTYEVHASVRTETWKYMLVHDANAGTSSERLYDLVSDPAERVDLFAGDASERPALPAAFVEAVERVRRRIGQVSSELGAHAGPGLARGVEARATSLAPLHRGVPAR
jgi:arylsulfatase A-like enzyme